MNMNIPRRSLAIVGASVVSALALAREAASTVHAEKPTVVEWDEQSEGEVMALLHHMHRAWNEGDIDFMRNAIAQDGFVGTFELTADEAPAVLGSREELVSYLENLMAGEKAKGIKSNASPRVVHNVKATSTFAICTEECDITEYHADGSRHVLPHRATSAVARTADGWRFIHWHVSQGGRAQLFDKAGHEVI